jgi:hypothetical protein
MILAGSAVTLIQLLVFKLWRESGPGNSGCEWPGFHNDDLRDARHISCAPTDGQKFVERPPAVNTTAATAEPPQADSGGRRFAYGKGEQAEAPKHLPEARIGALDRQGIY